MERISEQQFFVPIENGKLFCRAFGEPQNNALIVLHGGPGLGMNYLLPQMAALGEFSFAIFYDQRGTGDSIGSDDWQADPFQTYVNDLDCLRKALGLEKITLLAHSWGGMLASLYALSFPQHVNEIIYVCSVPVSSKNYLAFVKHRSELVNLHQAELDAIRHSELFLQGDPNTVASYYRIYFKNYFVKPELAETLTLTMTQQAALNNFKIYNLFYDYVTKNPFDLYQRLGELNKPSLIIAADHDVIPLHYPEYLHKILSSSKLITLNNCGHFPYIDQPENLFSAVERYIKHR